MTSQTKQAYTRNISHHDQRKLGHVNQGKWWTSEEKITLLRMRDSGSTVAQMSSVFGRNAFAVRQKLAMINRTKEKIIVPFSSCRMKRVPVTAKNSTGKRSSVAVPWSQTRRIICKTPTVRHNTNATGKDSSGSGPVAVKKGNVKHSSVSTSCSSTRHTIRKENTDRNNSDAAGNGFSGFWSVVGGAPVYSYWDKYSGTIKRLTYQNQTCEEGFCNYKKEEDDDDDDDTLSDESTIDEVNLPPMPARDSK